MRHELIEVLVKRGSVYKCVNPCEIRKSHPQGWMFWSGTRPRQASSLTKICILMMNSTNIKCCKTLLQFNDSIVRQTPPPPCKLEIKTKLKLAQFLNKSGEHWLRRLKDRVFGVFISYSQNIDVTVQWAETTFSRTSSKTFVNIWFSINSIFILTYVIILFTVLDWFAPYLKFFLEIILFVHWKKTQMDWISTLKWRFQSNVFNNVRKKLISV